MVKSAEIMEVKKFSFVAEGVTTAQRVSYEESKTLNGDLITCKMVLHDGRQPQAISDSLISANYPVLGLLTDGTIISGPSRQIIQEGATFRADFRISGPSIFFRNLLQTFIDIASLQGQVRFDLIQHSFILSSWSSNRLSVQERIYPFLDIDPVKSIRFEIAVPGKRPLYIAPTLENIGRIKMGLFVDSVS